jgi:hypothetical protein
MKARLKLYRNSGNRLTGSEILFIKEIRNQKRSGEKGQQYYLK